MAQASNIQVLQKYVRLVLGLSSIIVGMVCLSKSSFSEKQFKENKSLENMTFIIFTSLFVTLMFVGGSIKKFLQRRLDSKFYAIAGVNSFFLLIICALIFLVKYPRFSTHSALTKSCMEEETKKTSQGRQYNLFSVGSFCLLALVLSLNRQQSLELGIFTVLLGLTLDTSMEIPGQNGPNLWYMFGAALYCIFLMFIRLYIDSLMKPSTSGDNPGNNPGDNLGDNPGNNPGDNLGNNPLAGRLRVNAGTQKSLAILQLLLALSVYFFAPFPRSNSRMTIQKSKVHF